MGFGNNKKSSKGGTAKKAKSDKVFRKIGSIWENSNERGDYFNFSADDYQGDLIFRDKESGVFYKVKGANLYGPKEGAPKNLAYNLVLDIASEYHVDLMGGEEGEESSEES